mmetsp:Transcript_16035/g.24889  ORF Transcript_16035/g.24889 Transcript_16035/m.24889 type:complete len:97 (-) Transcript_16035:37-327(-)
MQLNTRANFEVIHGALCLIMSKLGATLGKDFNLKEHTAEEDKKYFPGRGADVMLQGKKVGTIGVLHPEALEAFQLKNPVCSLELDMAPLWAFFKEE